MAPPAAGTVVAEGVPGWAARREVLRFDAPVVGWLAGDIEPDGTLHARVVAQAYDAPVTAGREIDHPALVPAPWPVRLGGGRLAPVVAAEHTVPFPFCACGVPADYDLHRAHLDRFHDRLGYRMATIAL